MPKEIGRVKFAFYFFILNLIFGVGFQLLYERGLSYAYASPMERWGGLFWIIIIYGIFLGRLVEQRCNNIALFNWDRGAVAVFVVIGVVIETGWFFAVEDDALGLLKYQVATLLINFPIILYLLLMPSKKGVDTFRQTLRLKKEKQALTKEKKRLLVEQEIEKLKTDIRQLKNES